MIRLLITSALAIVSLLACSQDVLYLSNGSNVTITSGASITVRGGINAANGSSVLNNGNLYVTNNSIANQSNWSDANTAGVFTTGSAGMVYFQSANGHIISGNTVFPSVTLDAAGGATISNDISIANNLLLKTGKLNTGNYKLNVLNNASNAVQADAANTNYSNSWVNGKMQRNITVNTDSYDFPVGNTSQSNLLQFDNNNITGPSSLAASFGPKPGTDAGLMVTENGTPYIAVNNGGVWYLNADASATGGNYALQLYFNGFTGLADSQFGILRRPDASSNAADWIVPAGSALEPLNGAGRKVSDGYARRKNITTFSQLGIGMTTTTLPVQLLNFYAVRDNKTSVTLDWSTAGEINNKGFEIERRFENENQFAYDGFEASKAIGGNSQTLLTYTYHDLNSFSGITYYRIKQIDIDNRFVYSAIKAVKGLDNNTTVDVTIMPNPNRGQFKILISGVSQSHQAFITDITGKIIKQLNVQPLQEVNVQELPAATYILTIKDVFGKGENFKEKIIIIR
ncbi:MAG TPA: T9SS type A sorting domain-containing protein [Chitinophagaceae bacterium]|nr:T9SS type A sorting domain-containing protein [Chitinophagaceae bacterium]